MFERFTDKARRVVVLAQEEARLLDHGHIGTEHILLGLVHEGEGVGARALQALDVSLEDVRARVLEIVPQGEDPPSGHIPFTPRAKKVLELSLREALQFGHNYIGTEHILLGLVREGEGVGAQVLASVGADLPRVRELVVQLLASAGAAGPAEQFAGVGPRISQQQAEAMVAGGPGVYQELEPPRLARVIPLAREIYAGLGVRIVLISLEVWSGWFDLRYALLPEPTPGAPPQLLLGWEVADDAGTAYQRTGVAAGGGRRLQVTQVGFRPAPPEGTRILTLTVNDGDPATPLAAVEIDLVAGD
jgi:hypothetical protein